MMIRLFIPIVVVILALANAPQVAAQGAGPTVDEDALTPNLPGGAFRWKGNNSGDEIYLGVQDLGVGTNRVEAPVNNPSAGVYGFTFAYDQIANEVTLRIPDFGVDLAYPLAGNTPPQCAPENWNALIFSVRDSRADGGVVLQDVQLDGAVLPNPPLNDGTGNFGTADVGGTPGFQPWTVTDVDPSSGFVVTGDVQIVGSYGGNEALRVEFGTACINRLIIEKATQTAAGSDAPPAAFPFDFQATGPDGFDESFQLGDGAQQEFVVAAGTYSVSETINDPAGDRWTKVSAICDNEDSPDSVTLGDGDVVTCTFTNEYDFSRLKLTADCPVGDMRVRNENDYPVNYTWNTVSGQSGGGTAAPGDNSGAFNVGKAGVETARIFVDGVLNNTKATKIDCSSIDIVKTIVGDVGGQTFDFTITPTGDTGNPPAPGIFTLGNEQNSVFTGQRLGVAKTIGRLRLAAIR